MISNRLITAAELIRMPRGSSRCVLVRGSLIEQPYRTALAGAVGGTLCASLGRHVDEHALGVVFASRAGFQIGSDPDTVLAPAVAFVKMDHDELGDGYHPGPPDLAIEIVSELDDPAFVPAVVDEWLKAGCRCVIVVDPSPETITVYRSSADVQELSGADVLDVSDIVPGWTLSLREVFA
jgi:Uma2 family endonuclease